MVRKKVNSENVKTTSQRTVPKNHIKKTWCGFELLLIYLQVGNDCFHVDAMVLLRLELSV